MHGALHVFLRSCASLPVLSAVLVGVLSAAQEARADLPDVVLHASEAAVVKGHWQAASSSGAAGTRALISADTGWASLDAPLASPGNYFEMTFDAPAATTYRVWLRLRATGNSKWNDAVWVQFSDGGHGDDREVLSGRTGLRQPLCRLAGGIVPGGQFLSRHPRRGWIREPVGR